MQKYIIGIDSGTTGIKAVVFDLKGHEVAKQSYPLKAIYPNESQYEEDMHEIWEKAKLCIKTVSGNFPRESIIGLGITAQGDGLWMIDKNGEPVRNGVCFCDGRSSEFVDQWVDDGTCDKLFDLTGTRIFTGNQNGIVRWMEKYELENLDNAKYILHLKDYLFYKLTGEITTDASDQSLVLLDQHKRTYLDEAFSVTGISKYRDKYAPILSAKDNAFKIRSELADELGVSCDLIVTSGPMDVVACALGSGVVERGCCCSIIGTAALHEMVLDEPLQDHIKAGMTVTHSMDNRWLRLMASLAGTPNLEWVLDTFGEKIRINAMSEGISVYKYMEDMIRNVPIGANGVMYHPYLLAGGERAPFTDSRARGSYTGLSVRNTLADIVRATYEGVAYAMLDCYKNMPLEVKEITLCGGGAFSEFWSQMFADTLGSKIITVKGQELGALGAAINNAVVQDIYSDYLSAVNEIIEVDRIYEPNVENHKQYLKFYELYSAIRIQMKSTWKLRAQILKSR